MNREELINWCNRHLPTKKQYELETLLRETSASSELLWVMGGVFRELEEENHQLFEAWFWESWLGLGAFSAEEQAVLKYYFPLRGLLISDTQKSHCLSTVFGVPIELKKKGEKYLSDNDAPYIQEGELFEHQIFTARLVQQFTVKVGPIEATYLPEWMPGGQRRHFLTKGLFPLLLPSSGEVSIEILSDVEFVHDSNAKVPVYWNQNFKLA